MQNSPFSEVWLDGKFDMKLISILISVDMAREAQYTRISGMGTFR